MRFSPEAHEAQRDTLADRARDTGQWEVAAGYIGRLLTAILGNSPIWVHGHALKEHGHLASAERRTGEQLAAIQSTPMRTSNWACSQASGQNR